MSRPFAPYALRLAVLLSAGCSLPGCGATGLGWVGEAHVDSSEERAHVTALTNSRGLALIPATADLSATDEARPRLNRTITLGEVEAVAPSATYAGAAPPGVSVTINNYNQVNVSPPAYGYASLGAFAARPSFYGGAVGISASRPSAPSVSAPQPGQSWPAISDPGPSFPYHSTPSSPWARTR